MSESNIPVPLPSLGESVTEATVVEWLKQPGDTVALDEEIVEVTSDKADLRIPSPQAGVIAEIVAQPGDTLDIGGTLCTLAPVGATVAAPSPNGSGPAPTPAADAPVVDVVLPSLGESVTEATIVEWLKQPGDAVALDEEIAEITSDKADLRVPSPAAGVLTEIVAQPGDTIEVGGLLARLAEGATAAAGSAAPAPAASSAAAPARAEAAAGGGLASPMARRAAAEAGVDLNTVCLLYTSDAADE